MGEEDPEFKETALYSVVDLVGGEAGYPACSGYGDPVGIAILGEGSPAGQMGRAREDHCTSGCLHAPEDVARFHLKLVPVRRSLDRVFSVCPDRQTDHDAAIPYLYV